MVATLSPSPTTDTARPPLCVSTTASRERHFGQVTLNGSFSCVGIRTAILRSFRTSFTEYLTLISSPVPELTPDELRDMLQKLEHVCRQAQELQQQIKEKMTERARDRSDHPAESDAGAEQNRRGE